LNDGKGSDTRYGDTDFLEALADGLSEEERPRKRRHRPADQARWRHAQSMRRARLKAHTISRRGRDYCGTVARR
jgi:hypothetical protein